MVVITRSKAAEHADLPIHIVAVAPVDAIVPIIVAEDVVPPPNVQQVEDIDNYESDEDVYFLEELLNRRNAAPVEDIDDYESEVDDPIPEDHIDGEDEQGDNPHADEVIEVRKIAYNCLCYRGDGLRCGHKGNLGTNQERGNVIRHIQKMHNNIPNEQFDEHLKQPYGFLRCEVCNKICMGTRGLNQHRVIHAPGYINNNNNNNVGVQAQNNVINVEEMLELVDPLVDPQVFAARSAALYSIRNNDIDIISEISKLINRILNICINRAGAEDQEQFNKANKALLVITGIIQMKQEMAKNKTLAVWRNNIMAFIGLILGKVTDILIIDSILEEHNILLHLYTNFIIARKNRKAGNTPLKQRQAKRIVMLTKAGKLKKATALAEKVRVMEDDATTMGSAPLQGEAMKVYVTGNGLYPERVEVLQQEILASNVTFTIEEVALALSQLNRESSPGMTGWTNEWLATLANPEHNNKSAEFVQAITAVFNLMVRNSYGISTVWTESRLVLIEKPGVTDLRPIAIGDSLIRAFGKVLSRNQKDHALQCLQGTQFGVHVKGGAEIVAQFCRMAERKIKHAEWVDDDNVNDELMIIAYDIKNAFGTASRSIIEQGVITFMPQIHQAFRFLYGCESKVFHDDGTEVATIKTGVRQGDPMAAIFFCLGMKVLLDEIPLVENQGKLVAYMDDVSAFGKRSEMIRVAVQLKEQFRRGGMEMNGIKSAIITKARGDDVPNEAGRVGEIVIDGELTIPRYNWFKAMGVPIGDNVKVQEAIVKQVVKASSILPWIHTLPPDTAYALLRFCINTRLIYLLRNITPATIREVLVGFDDMVDAALCSIAEISEMPPLGATLRGLPVQLHGLAIPRMVDISGIAFYASLLQAIQYFQLEEQNFIKDINDTRNVDHTTWVVPGAERDAIYRLLPDYVRNEDRHMAGGEAPGGGLDPIIPNPIVIPLNEELKLATIHKQDALFEAFNKACYGNMIQQVRDDLNKVFLCYLVALPSSPMLVPLLSGITSNITHQLTPMHFRELLRRKLAAPLYDIMQGPTTRCLCRKEHRLLLDENPVTRTMTRAGQVQHVGMCTQVSGRIRSDRHTLLKKAVVNCIKAVAPYSQVRTEQRIPNTNITMDITMANVANGTGDLIDVTCVGAMKGKALRTQGVNGETVILEAQGRKERRILEQNIDGHGGIIQFIPFVVTDTGRLGKKTMEFIDKITGWDRVPRVANATMARARKELFKTIGVITEKSNARLRIALRQSLVWVPN